MARKRKEATDAVAEVEALIQTNAFRARKREEWRLFGKDMAEVYKGAIEQEVSPEVALNLVAMWIERVVRFSQ